MKISTLAVAGLVTALLTVPVVSSYANDAVAPADTTTVAPSDTTGSDAAPVTGTDSTAPATGTDSTAPVDGDAGDVNE